MKNQNLINLLLQVIEQNKTTITMLQSILSEIDPHEPRFNPVEVRGMDSMQMIESILEVTQRQNTLEFITGLKDHLNNRRNLSESQRFHLESTYNQHFGDS